MANDLPRPFGELRRNPGRGDWFLRFPSGEGRKRAELAIGAGSDEERSKRRALIADLVKVARQRKVMAQPEVQEALVAVAGESNPDRLDAWVSAARAVISGAAAPIPVAPKIPTLRQFSEQWTSGELAKRYPHHVKDRKDDGVLSGLRPMLAGKLGDTPIDAVTLDTVEAALANLPRGIMQSTARTYSAALRTLLQYAVYPCRYLESNPCVLGVLPRNGKRRAMTFLRPEEDARFLACREVPIEWRIWIGFMCREGLRAYIEAAELRWRDIDLKTGTVTLKARSDRTFALDQGVVRALKAWHGITGGEPHELVFRTQHGQQFHGAMTGGTAVLFRKLLFRAGVRRAELHHPSDGAIPIRVEDCRGTFVTISLATGKTERWVQDRTGHVSSTSLNRCFRNARTASELGLGGLTPLYSAIPELLEATYQEAAE